MPVQHSVSSGVKLGDFHAYIVNHQEGGIIVHPEIDADPDAIIDKDWRVALPALKRKYPKPVFSRVEIHCHGMEAEIRLDPLVTMRNVDEFGLALKGLVPPGALVEILACRVAGFPLREVLAEMRREEGKGQSELDNAKAYSRSYAYWYNETLTPEFIARQQARHQIHARGTVKFGSDWAEIKQFIGPFMKTGAWEYNQYKGVDAKTKWTQGNKPVVLWKKVHELGDRIEGRLYPQDMNGPRFCKRLAKVSGLTIRAAWINQEQERAGLIGDWESFVFDFDSSGLQTAYWLTKRPLAKEPTWVASAIRPMDGASGRDGLAIT